MVFVALSAFAQTTTRDFDLGGAAQLLGSDCIRLTPDQPYVGGSAWFRSPIDLSRPFEMRLSLVLGPKDAEGADGIAFVFHPTMATGFRGEGMGFAGLAPSLGIEFDTYRNVHLDDPAADHLAVMLDGDRWHAPGTALELGNLEDGARHPLRIVWDPGAQRLLISLDNRVVLRTTLDLVGHFGRPVVYWGMTAATGRLHNPQDVCIEQLWLGS